MNDTTETTTDGVEWTAQNAERERALRIERYGSATVFRVPSENVARLLSDVERLNKRARRLHLDPIVASFVREERIAEKEDGVTIERVFRLYDVQGTTPVLAGWHFVASLSKIDTQVLITTAAGQVMPRAYLKADPTNCDHCHVARARATTFIVEHEDGRTAQVGRQCLADFIRTTNPAQLAAQAEFLTSLDFGPYEDDEPGGDRPSYGPDRRSIAARDFMALVVRVVAREGAFVSKGAAAKTLGDKPEHRLTSTVKHVSDLMAAETLKTAPITEAEHARADELIEWARTWTEREDLGDYEQNVATVSRMEFWPAKAWGVGASIVAAASRSTETAKAREGRPESSWIGTPKKRETFTLRLASEPREIPNDFGTTTLYRFEDEAGNVVRYFASRPVAVPTAETYTRKEAVWKKGDLVRVCPVEHPEGQHNLFPNGDESRPWCETAYAEKTYPVMRPIAVGDTVRMKATVKAHDEFKGQKQTLITRGVVEALTQKEGD